MSDGNVEAVRKEFETARGSYESLADGLRPLISQLCEAEKLAIDSITARVKDTRSLVEKFQRRGRSYESLAEITDLCGIRIITKYESTVAPTLALLAREFDVVEAVHHRSSAPEVFGYKSEHLLIRLKDPRASLLEWRNKRDLIAEVQVRSILQHAWAAISHGLDYKSEREIPTEARRRLFRVAALLESADESFDQYRDDVDVLRTQYAAEAQSGDWRGLAIDGDSLRAGWEYLPVQKVLEAANEAGFAPYPIPIDQSKPPESWFTDEASSILLLAESAGMKTLGDLEQAMQEAISDVASLRSFADRSEILAGETEMGERVANVVPDVVMLHQLMKQQDNRLLYEEADEYFFRHLLDAARSA